MSSHPRHRQMTPEPRPSARHAGAHAFRPRHWQPGCIRVTASVIALSGLVATMTLPAAAAPAGGALGPAAGRAHDQSLVVAATLPATVITRDTVTATTQEQLDAARAAAAAEAARQAATRRRATTLAGSPTAETIPRTAPMAGSGAGEDALFGYAEQYIGTPYVFGGSTPAGFDCSGYVMFVYARFGVALPHSVSGEAAHGVRIAVQDAVPGDLVVMSGHIGFYAGGGNILDSPDVGRSISVRPIWTDDFTIVRIDLP